MPCWPCKLNRFAYKRSYESNKHILNIWAFFCTHMETNFYNKLDRAKGSFKQYVDKMKWVGGSKITIFLHVHNVKWQPKGSPKVKRGQNYVHVVTEWLLCSKMQNNYRVAKISITYTLQIVVIVVIMTTNRTRGTYKNKVNEDTP